MAEHADVFLPIDDVIELTGFSRRTIYYRLAEEGWPIQRVPCAGKRRFEVQVALRALPKSAQSLYWTKHLIPAPVTTTDPLNLAEIPEALRTEARRRLSILEQAEPILAQPRGIRKEALEVFCKDREISVATFYKWLANYERGGIGALLPKWGWSRGQFTALSTPIQAFIKDDYCSPAQPSPTTVYRHVLTMCQHLNEPVPSQATVNRFILQLPSPAKVLAREGPKAWRAKSEPKCHRDLNALAPNEWWCGDHRVFDAIVKTHRGEGAKLFRPWVTWWYDLATRTGVGRHVGLVPNSNTIALALRNGILRFGVPQNLYIDNGKDYRCEYLNGKTVVSRNVQLSADTTDTLAPGILSPLGVSITHATPYQAWSKPIEPWFKHTFTEWEKSLPGYCGRNAQSRPEKLKGEIERDEILTLEEFIERLDAHVEQYHRTEHGELGMSPLAAWRDTEIVRPNPRTLDLLLMRQKSVKVTAQGIKQHGRWYWSDELYNHVGHSVEIRFGEELGRVIVFANGKFLCEALNDPAMQMGATREDLAALQRRKQLAKKRVTAYVEDRGVLRDPDKELARIAADARKQKVVALPPSPTPAGVRAVPKMLPAFDQAAAALHDTPATEATPATLQESPSRRGRRSDQPSLRPTSKSAAGSAGPDRYELLEELLG